MYCPRCGQPQSHEQTRFCSKCGFLMAGVGEFVRNGGQPSVVRPIVDENAVSPKKRGLKQGGILFLSGMIVVPILAILSELVNAEPVLAGAAAVILFWGGILRMVYALIFQPGKPTSPEKSGLVSSLKDTFVGSQDPQRLPQATQQPADFSFENREFNWRETEDLEPSGREPNRTTRIG